MDSDNFAKLLMDESRRQAQNPSLILEQIGILEGSTVADIGCGPGFFAVEFSKRVGKGGRLYAIDSDPVMIKHLRANLKQLAPATFQVVKVIESLASKTGIPDASVDCVFFANVLHDIADIGDFFREIKRIRKDNSSLIVDIDWHKREMDFGPPFDIRLSEGETRNLLRQTGFKVVHLINAGPDHYGFVAKYTL